MEKICCCDICGKELYDGDKAYATTDGQVKKDCEGFMPSQTEQWNIVACASCGERISDKICSLYME